LVEAGNYAGRAIALTRTNIVHSTSYNLTINYGIEHGTACSILLPDIVSYMNNKELPIFFGLKNTQELVCYLRLLRDSL